MEFHHLPQHLKAKPLPVTKEVIALSLFPVEVEICTCGMETEIAWNRVYMTSMVVRKTMMLAFTLASIGRNP